MQQRIAFQRETAETILKLLIEGEIPEADALLDDIIERRRHWRT